MGACTRLEMGSREGGRNIEGRVDGYAMMDEMGEWKDWDQVSDVRLVDRRDERGGTGCE